MKTKLDRKNFKKEWVSLVISLVIIGLVPFGTAIPVETRTQGILLTIGLTLVMGGATVVFLRRENIRLRDIGLGKSAWTTSLLMFGIWWVLITGLDFVSSWVTEMSGSTMPREQIAWSPVMALDWFRAWVVVGLVEELTYRGYLHNKFAVLFKKKWIGIALAALAFGLWHIPASIILRGSTLLGALPGALGFGLISLVLFNGPYELTGLMPLLVLFHGWSDFPLLVTLQRPNSVAAVAGYVLFLFMVGIFAWKKRRQIILQKGAGYVS
jgi:membrane protease YdiL (CAAX protease family)